MANADRIASTDEWKENLRAHDEVFASGDGGPSGPKGRQQERRIEELKETPVFSGHALAHILDFQKPKGGRFCNEIFPQYGLLAKILDKDSENESLSAKGETPNSEKGVKRENTALETNLTEQNYHSTSNASPQPTNSCSKKFIGIEIDPAMSEPEPELIDSRLFVNINTPWSAFICGEQGKGKSNTLSCLLEAGLLKQDKFGILDQSLTGLVFHYDQFSSANRHSICEAAYLASKSDLSVNVFVSADNHTNMKKVYEEKLGLTEDAKNFKVLPLYFKETQISVRTMRKLMSVGEAGKSVLYLEVINRILRAMSMEDQEMQGISYGQFLDRLKKEKFNESQRDGLGLRLGLLEAFLHTKETATDALKKGATTSAKPKEGADVRAKKRFMKMCEKQHFEVGALNIVDLSSHHIDPEDACMLFSIALEIFLQEVGNSGSIIALDEAHKYMTGTGHSDMFTQSLLSVIRLQRHLATRVVIATQEPTISPSLLDLCSMTIVHHFKSYQWMAVLEDHLAGATGKDGDRRNVSHNIYNSIVALEKGEALLFSPSAILECETATKEEKLKPKKLGKSYAKILVRPKLTKDGGRSVNAVQKPKA